MNENIKEFTDQDQGIRDAISNHASRYFNNPRDTKRFVNLFRFYYFLRAARQARAQRSALGGSVVPLDRIRPEVARNHTLASRPTHSSGRL